MEIVLLGTGSPVPNPDRAGPATLVRLADGSPVLVDAGRGVVMRLAAAGVLPVQLAAVALTHLHSDHISDLNDVVTTHWVMTQGPTPLRVFGPPGTARVVGGLLEMLALDQRYRHDHHADLQHPPDVQVTEVGPGDSFLLGGATVAVHETDHRPVAPTVGYRITDAGGPSVALAGDGVPCPTLDTLCRGADAYVQTVIRDDLVKLVPSARFQDICDYHSTVQQAAQTAARAGVKTLVLTHLVPSPPAGAEDDWCRLAAEHFEGRIVAGPDLTSVTV